MNPEVARDWAGAAITVAISVAASVCLFLLLLWLAVHVGIEIVKAVQKFHAGKG